MALVDRVIPNGAKPINFLFKDQDDFGVLNLCCWQDDFRKIRDLHKKVIRNKTINIFVPMFDHYYVKSYTSQNGFTLRQLLNRIIRAFQHAGRYHIRNHPEGYVRMNRRLEPSDYFNEYGITSDRVESDIMKKGGNIYVEIFFLGKRITKTPFAGAKAG